jgi:peptidyl-prolyl cis-trans isomerase C/peptidyl-prolyl cis-trans isomerase D
MIGLVFGLAWCLTSGPAVGAQTLATVGSVQITVEEFNRRLGELRGKVVALPTNQEFLEDLIRYKLGLQEAERLKLAQDPVVRERFDQVVYNSLLDREIGPKLEKVAVRESEMKAYYVANPELHLAHVLIDVREDAPAEEREAARKLAREKLAEIRRHPRPFEEFVKLYSDDPSTKDNGGDLGYQTRATLLPDIYDLAVKMKVGDITGPVETKDGFHILKLIDRRAYDLADKRQIRTALIDQARVELFNAYFERLKKQKGFRVDLNKEAFRSLQ